MKNALCKLPQVFLFFLIFFHSCIHGVLLNPCPIKPGYDHLEKHHDVFNVQDWESVLVREFESEPSQEPLVSPEFATPEASIEEVSEMSEEDEYPLPPISDRYVDGRQKRNDNFSLLNDVLEEPADDSEFVIIQDAVPVQFSTSSPLAFSSRTPICVVHRKQMKCFIRKRCGVFVKNGKRRSGTKGPLFRFGNSNIFCKSKCGWKAGRQCTNRAAAG